MSEGKTSYMAELDSWSDATIIIPSFEVRFPRLQLGQIVATPGALTALSESGQSPASFLMRHVSGDWGDLDEPDCLENELSVAQNCRVLSAYRLSNGTKLWIITEADRRVTTLLLPSEY